MVGGDDDAGRAARAGLPRARARRTATRTSAPSGAGHFVKMVHNGIEYGLMQAYAEGFEVMERVRVRPRPARDRRHLALRLGRPLVAARAAARRVRARRAAQLEKIRGYVEDSGEGRWTIAEAIAEDVPVPVITAALFARFASRQDESFAAKVNAALRNQFGGHAVQAAEGTSGRSVTDGDRAEPAARGAARCGGGPSRASSSSSARRAT